MALSDPTEVYKHFGGKYFLHLQAQDTGSTFLRNVYNFYRITPRKRIIFVAKAMIT
jgi:hypothetical protein